MILYVNGEERYRTKADFSAVEAPLSIWSQVGSTVKVLLAEMVPLR